MSIKSNIIILYVISAIIATILGFAFYHNLQFDANSSAGVIVAALSGIITLLVGFQIYNAIEINREMRRHAIRIQRFESTFARNLESLKEGLLENRYLSNALIKAEHVKDWQRWKGLEYLYMETGDLLKYLILSNVNKYNIFDEGSIFIECISILEDCLNKLDNETKEINIRMFNSQHSSLDKLHEELMSLLRDPYYGYDEGDQKVLIALKEKREMLLKKYGIFDRNHC